MSLKEYPVIAGRRYNQLPKKSDFEHVLLTDGRIYKKETSSKFCGKCDKKHVRSNWVQIILDEDIAFLDIHNDKVYIVRPDEMASMTSSNSNSQIIKSNSYLESPCVPSEPKRKRELPREQAKLRAFKSGQIDENTLTYIINITNISSVIAQNVCVEDQLPETFNWKIISPVDKCKIVNGCLHCQLGNIVPGQVSLVKFSTTINGPVINEIVNTAQVSADNAPLEQLKSIIPLP